MKKFDTILFDFDGTLADSLPAVGRGVLDALAHFGADGGTLEDVRHFIGPPLRESFEQYPAVAGRFDEVFPVYRAAHAKYLDLYRIYDGIPEVLRALNSAGLTVGVATAKIEESAVEILRMNGLLECFDFVAGVVDGQRDGKNEVIEYAIARSGSDRTRIAMVGDRKFDINGGKAFGLYTVGCLWGFGSMDELRGCGADEIAENPLCLTEILL